MSKPAPAAIRGETIASYLTRLKRLSLQTFAKMGPSFPSAKKKGLPAGKSTGQSPSYILAILNGQVTITETILKNLAQAFDCDKESLGVQIKALGESPMPRRDELVRNISELRIGQLDHPPLAGTDGSLVNSLINVRFRQHCGASPAKPHPADSVLELQSALIEEKLDMIAHLGTVERHLRFRFVNTTPIRLSLGVLCPSGWKRFFPKLRQVAASREARLEGPAVKPIVVDGECGYLHCVNSLGFERKELELVDFQLDKMADALSPSRWKGSDHIPLLFVDELTALQLMKRYGRWLWPVVPPTTARSARLCPERQSMPLHQFGLAVRRGDRDLAQFFEDSLRAFLLGDVETVSEKLWILSEELLDLLTIAFDAVPTSYLVGSVERDGMQLGDAQIRASLARRWIRFALGLERAHFEAIDMAWKPIARRTAERIRHELAGRPKVIRAFIAASADSHGWYKLHRILGDAEEEFGIVLPKPSNYSTEGSVEAVTAQVRTALLGYPAPINPVFTQVDPEQLHHTEAQKILRRECWRSVADKHLMRQRLGSADTQIIAFVEREPAAILEFNSGDGCVELKVLFVRPIWRGYGITRRMIEWWKRMGGAHGRVLVVPPEHLTDDQLVLIEQLGFQRDPAATEPDGGTLSWNPSKEPNSPRPKGRSRRENRCRSESVP